MAYISTEEVKAIRAAIKNAFPSKKGWKISVTRDHGTSVNVCFMTAPVNLDPENKGNYPVNPYWIDEHYADNTLLRAIFNGASECINGIKEQVDRNAGDMGADYGDCNFFYDINVGKWNQDFKQV